MPDPSCTPRIFTIEYAYRRFSTRRFALPTEAQLRALERRIHVELPEDYRQLLLEYNGGYFDDPDILPEDEDCPMRNLAGLCGIGASHSETELGTERSLAIFDDNDPPLVLPIGHTPRGDLILLDTAPGEERGYIYLKIAFGDSHHLADGIEEFFGLLRERTDEDE